MNDAGDGELISTAVLVTAPLRYSAAATSSVSRWAASTRAWSGPVREFTRSSWASVARRSSRTALNRSMTPSSSCHAVASWRCRSVTGSANPAPGVASAPTASPATSAAATSTAALREFRIDPTFH